MAKVTNKRMASRPAQTLSSAAPMKAEKASSKAPKVEVMTETIPEVTMKVHPEITVNVESQAMGKSRDTQDLAAIAKSAFMHAGHEENEIRTVDVYLKPEENKAYYLVNGNFSGSADLF